MNICMNEAVGKITFTDGLDALIEADTRLTDGNFSREGWEDSTLIEMGLVTQARVDAEAGTVGALVEYLLTLDQEMPVEVLKERYRGYSVYTKWVPFNILEHVDVLGGPGQQTLYLGAD